MKQPGKQVRLSPKALAQLIAVREALDADLGVEIGWSQAIEFLCSYYQRNERKAQESQCPGNSAAGGGGVSPHDGAARQRSLDVSAVGLCRDSNASGGAKAEAKNERFEGR